MHSCILWLLNNALRRLICAIINASQCPVFRFIYFLILLQYKFPYMSIHTHTLQTANAFFKLTFEDVPALQLLHIGSLAQPPAEKHQHHVLNHFLLCPPRRGLAAAPCPIPLRPAPVSSLRSYVSISHPNRGCAASAEARPTSGTAGAKTRFFPPSSFSGVGVHFSPADPNAQPAAAAASSLCSQHAARPQLFYYPPRSECERLF